MHVKQRRIGGRSGHKSEKELGGIKWIIYEQIETEEQWGKNGKYLLIKSYVGLVKEWLEKWQLGICAARK